MSVQSPTRIKHPRRTPFVYCPAPIDYRPRVEFKPGFTRWALVLLALVSLEGLAALAMVTIQALDGAF